MRAREVDESMVLGKRRGALVVVALAVGPVGLSECLGAAPMGVSVEVVGGSR